MGPRDGDRIGCRFSRNSSEKPSALQETFTWDKMILEILQGASRSRLTRTAPNLSAGRLLSPIPSLGKVWRQVAWIYSSLGKAWH